MGVGRAGGATAATGRAPPVTHLGEAAETIRRGGSSPAEYTSQWARRSMAGVPVSRFNNGLGRGRALSTCPCGTGAQDRDRE